MKLKKLFLMPALLWVVSLEVYAQATLAINDFKIKSGESKEVTIDMTNSVPIRALQVQVVFPEGVTMGSRPTVVKDRIGSYEDEFGELVECNKTLDYNKWEDGSYMIVVNAMDGYPFSGNEGPIISFKVKAAADASLGMTTITLQNMILVYEDGETNTRPANAICNVEVYHDHTPDANGVCTLCSEPLELVINDNETTCPDFAPEYETYAKVTYNREFNTKYTYNTLVLPFAPDEESLKNFRFYTLSSVADDAITFEEVSIPVANTPYLCCLQDGATVTNCITGGVTTISTDVETVSRGMWQFVGSFKNETIDCTSDATTDNYVFNPARNTLHKVSESLNVCPFSAYLKNILATPSAYATMRVYISHPSGIEEISKDAIQGFDTGMYDLQGRALSRPMKGQIYIENGKKKVSF